MTVQQWNVRYATCGTIYIECQGITKAESRRFGSRKKSLNKLQWYCLTCDRIAVNFMKTMANLHTKHQILEDKMDNLEE